MSDMSANSGAKNWFVNLTVAAKLRVLIVASNIVTVLVGGVCAGTLVTMGAHWGVIALPLTVAAFSVTTMPPWSARTSVMQRQSGFSRKRCLRRRSAAAARRIRHS